MGWKITRGGTEEGTAWVGVAPATAACSCVSRSPGRSRQQWNQLIKMAGEEIEDNLEEMSLLAKKKLSGTKKGIFTRHVKSCENQLDISRFSTTGK